MRITRIGFSICVSYCCLTKPVIVGLWLWSRSDTCFPILPPHPAHLCHQGLGLAWGQAHYGREAQKAEARTLWGSGPLPHSILWQVLWTFASLGILWELVSRYQDWAWIEFLYLLIEFLHWAGLVGKSLGCGLGFHTGPGVCSGLPPLTVWSRTAGREESHA